MAKKPNIRFAGFEDDWEQRKLGEICDSFEYGLNAAATDYDGENKYIRITDIDDNSHEFLQNKVTSPDIDFSGAENYKLKQGDILFARTGASVGKTYIYKESDGVVYYAGFLIRGRVKDEYSPEFVFQNTLTADYERFIRITSQRSGQPGVNAQEYASYKIATPVLEEQQQIGAYFSTLDHLITLHQRKCDELKKVKKFMLQKMFPKKGEKNPEIRFDGFTNDWEQRKLGEVCSEIGDGLHSAPKYNDNGEVFFINGNNLVDGHIVIDPLKTRRVSKETFEKNNKHLDNNTLLLSINGTIGNLAYYQGEQVMLGKSIAYLKVNGIDHFFLYTSLQTAEILNSFMISLTGTTIKNLGLEAIKNTIIAVPKLEEQHKIGVYFSALDHLITLHQRKCEELKNVKKYMLQNMFAKGE